MAALRHEGLLHDERLAQSLLTTPREVFVPGFATEHGIAAVYRDEAIATKWDARRQPISSSSQPAMMVMMIEALAIGVGARVLEIGAGTGYNAAILAQMVGSAGCVVSVELDDDVAAAARVSLAVIGSPVEVVTGDGYLGWGAGAPYDAVIATASVQAPPRSWHEQLRPGGRMIAPVSLGEVTDAPQVVAAFDRTVGGFRSRRLIPAGFVPMRHGAGEVPVGPEADGHYASPAWGILRSPEHLVLAVTYDEAPEAVPQPGDQRPGSRYIRTVGDVTLSLTWEP